MTNSDITPLSAVSLLESAIAKELHSVTAETLEFQDDDYMHLYARAIFAAYRRWRVEVAPAVVVKEERLLQIFCFLVRLDREEHLRTIRVSLQMNSCVAAEPRPSIHTDKCFH